MQDADTNAAADLDAEDLYSPTPADEPADTGGEDKGQDGDDGPTRDEHGRFAKAEAEAEAAANVADKAKGDGEDRDGGQIPSWRLREIREERDRIAAEREKDRQELEVMRRERAMWQQQLRQQQEAEQAPQAPDPIADPHGYQAYVEQQLASRFQSVEQQMRNWRVNMTFADQHEQHGEAFEKAMQALESSRDKDAIQTVMESINPGKALMKWHSRHRAMTEVGDDLDGYNAKLRAKLKADPEFRKEFMAELDAEARGGSERSDNVTSLPSLSRAPGGSAHRGDAEDMDTESLYTPARARR